jgi:hypothetical protein
LCHTTVVIEDPTVAVAGPEIFIDEAVPYAVIGTGADSPIEHVNAIPRRERESAN